MPSKVRIVATYGHRLYKGGELPAFFQRIEEEYSVGRGKNIERHLTASEGKLPYWKRMAIIYKKANMAKIPGMQLFIYREKLHAKVRESLYLQTLRERGHRSNKRQFRPPRIRQRVNYELNAAIRRAQQQQERMLNGDAQPRLDPQPPRYGIFNGIIVGGIR